MSPLSDLVRRNRSYRRFFADVPISREKLESWVDLARLSASGRNAQPLRFFLSHTPETNASIFPSLAWASFLTDWPGPELNERPPAYILILGDTSISKQFFVDHGIAAQSILLGAVEDGYGGCMIMSIRKTELAQTLNLPEHLEILMVLALGKPKETVVIEEAGADTRYWRSPDQIHHVPKRSLRDILWP